MSDKYFKAIDPNEWIRNPQWVQIPVDNGNENKIYLTYAVIEDNPNQIGLFTSKDSVINWGDGNSDTQNGVTYDPVYHEYDYATVSGPILQLEDGRNYKTVLIDCTLDNLTGYYLFYIHFNNANLDGGSNNVLEIVSYLGDGTTVSGVNETRLICGNSSYPVLMEHLKVKTPNNNNINYFIRYAKNLQKIELPNGFFHTGITNSSFFSRLASINGYNFGDISTSSLTSFSYANSFKVGNIVIPISVSNIDSMCIHSNNYSIGNFTATGVTSAVYAFGGTVNNGMNSIGIIDMPSLEDARYIFRRSQMPEVVFTDCSNIDNTYSMFSQVYSVQKLIMPDLTVGVNISNNNLTATAIDAFFTSVGTAAGTQTLDVSDNPGSSTCDTTIATAKGWTVIT